jgi:hypothetical protein
LIELRERIAQGTAVVNKNWFFGLTKGEMSRPRAQDAHML